MKVRGKVYVNDIVGRVFGEWLVADYAGYWDKRHHYRCECSCGKEKIVLRSSLIYGRSQSCGECREPNIVKEGLHYRYYCTNGQSFIFDEIDFPLLARMVCSISERGYVTLDRKQTLLTHLLLGCEKHTIVDHVNGDPFDNRRCNLRIAEGNKNKWNYAISVRNQNGYKGIYPNGKRGGFEARICENGRRHYLGHFDTPEEAARAYDEAARFYFGEFACVNFPRPGEQGCRRNQNEEGTS